MDVFDRAAHELANPPHLADSRATARAQAEYNAQQHYDPAMTILDAQRRAAELSLQTGGAFIQPHERPADFIARMMANIGQDQTTLRKADYLRLCQMAAKGL